MTRIIFIEQDGTERSFDATDGHTLMEVALKGGVAGIVAECGGACACATCHVALPGELYALLGKPAAAEDDMLDFASAPRQPCSRLGCQVKISPQLDGAVIHIPAF